MKKALLILLGSVGVIAIVAILATSVFSSLGYAYWGVKQPAEVVTLRTDICNAGDIQKYNALVVVFPTNQEQQTKKIADFAAHATSIAAKKDYEKDPNCVFMVYAAAIQNTNQDEAKMQYETLVKLSESGAYPSNAILDIVSLPSMKDRVDGLTTNEADLFNPLGSG